MHLPNKISLKHRIFSSGGLAFFTMLVWEGVESLLEYAIAYFISSAITLLAVKLLTTFIIVTLTQTMVRQLQKIFMKIINKLTYKEGEDKVEKLKQFWRLIKANKCSLIVILATVLLGASGTSLINVEELPAIPFWDGEVIEAVIQEEDVVATEIIYEEDGTTIKYNVGDVIISAGTVLQEEQVIPATNLTPYIYYGLLSIVVIICGIFFENPTNYENRKEEANLIKEAKKELAKEELKAVSEEEQKIIEQKKKLADAEKAKQEEQKRIKVEEIKAKIKAGNL